MRKRNQCCHKLEILKAVDNAGEYYYEIRRCKRCGITEKNYGLGCSCRKCLNCGENYSWLNDKN